MDQRDLHLPWLGAWLTKRGVGQLTAVFSGGGDSGDLDGITYYDKDGREMSSLVIDRELDDLEIMDGSGNADSFRDELVSVLESHASDLGDYCNNEGGMVSITMEIHPVGLEITESWFEENVWDDEEPEDEFEDEEMEP